MGQTESVGVEVCVIAADRARTFQGAQPAVAGREAEADSLRQPDVADRYRRELVLLTKSAK